MIFTCQVSLIKLTANLLFLSIFKNEFEGWNKSNGYMFKQKILTSSSFMDWSNSHS